MEEEQNISPISSAKDSGLGVIMFDSLLSHFSGNSQSENLDPALLDIKIYGTTDQLGKKYTNTL